MTNKRNTGNYGENIASLYLKKRGFFILHRNFFSRFGEIDIIALKEKQLLFIEVKYRKSLFMGSPEESITEFKKKRLLKTAQYFLMLNPQYTEYNIRFDLIAITDINEVKINHLRNIIKEN